MKTALFIARRIIKKDSFNYSRPIIRIAILSIVLGLSMMILAVAILTGFQNEISGKVTGFGAHIRISPFDSNRSYENKPVSKKQPFYPEMNLEHVEHIQVFATKAGIVKNEGKIQGVVLKGVDEDYNWDFFRSKLKEGNVPDYSNEKASMDILISKSMADMMEVETGDKLRTYFIMGDHQRGRPFVVSGIFDTGLTDFDDKFIIGDITNIQRLNGWDADHVGGFEVMIDDLDNLAKARTDVYNNVPFDLNVQDIKTLHPEIFDWLKLQDMNVIIILIIMVLVASVTMISTLLIIILERTNMIGILKAMGMKNGAIRRLFLYNASFIVLRGLALGNLIAVSLAMLQKHLQLIKLDEASYFMTHVPINLQVSDLLWINAGTLLVCYLMMVAPSYIITRISPVKAIRFE
ncbi:MAG: ABC transporter permease [Bacteroidota bacterium]